MVLSNYQTKRCKTTFLALPRITYIIFNRPVEGKTKLLPQQLQQTIIITELQINLQKLISICCCSRRRTGSHFAGGEENFALKITICPETNFFSLIRMGGETSCKFVLCS